MLWVYSGECYCIPAGPTRKPNKATESELFVVLTTMALFIFAPVHIFNHGVEWSFYAGTPYDSNDENNFICLN